MKANASNAVPASANAPAARSLCNSFTVDPEKTLLKSRVFHFFKLFSTFFCSKSCFLTNQLYIICTSSLRGVVAKRSGSGLQNRINRFDSDPRLHFFLREWRAACGRSRALLRCSLGRVQSYTPSLRVLQNATSARNPSRLRTSAFCPAWRCCRPPTGVGRNSLALVPLRDRFAPRLYAGRPYDRPAWRCCRTPTGVGRNSLALVPLRGRFAPRLSTVIVSAQSVPTRSVNVRFAVAHATGVQPARWFALLCTFDEKS